jgi:hypothetical protein
VLKIDIPYTPFRPSGGIGNSVTEHSVDLGRVDEFWRDGIFGIPVNRT